MVSPITPPVARLNNLPINQQFYKPSVFFISGITIGTQTIVTTSVSHNYVVGQQVRFYIPPYWGIRQLDGKQGLVVNIPASNQVTVSLNSTYYDAFNNAGLTTQPQIMAIGDTNSGPTNTGRTNNQTFIDGSFINISP